MWAGWKPGQKVLNFWGARQDIQHGNSLIKQYQEYVSAEKTIAAYEYTEAQLGLWAKAIFQYQPVLLQGYASILGALARYILGQKIIIPGGLLGVYSTAEVLYQEQREQMERAFGCKVFNQYGSREIPNIACECQHGNQHIFTDMVYLESIAEDRLIVTSLTNRVMPLIRYDIGDAGKLKEDDCPCGSPFSMMEMGLCRSNDLIKTRSGKSIHPAYFNGLLYGQTDIQQYQYIQEKYDVLTLNIVSQSNLSKEKIDALQSRIHHDIDKALRLEVNHANEIPRSASGKHRFVICNL